MNQAAHGGARRRLAVRAGTLVVAVMLALGLPGRTVRAQQQTSADLSVDSLLERAARGVAAGRTLRASFEQTLTNPDIRQTRVSRGTFAQAGPMRFAFRFTDPAGDAIVADGTAIWVYLPSSAPGQALKLPLSQGAQLDLLTQLLVAPRSSYTVTARPSAELDGRRVTVLHLAPRLAGTPFASATLWIDTESALVRQLEAVELSGLVRRIRFRDIRPDVELPREALTFAVPANVKVVDATALMGGRPPALR